MRRQEQMYDSALELLNEIDDHFKAFTTDQPFYDALKSNPEDLVEPSSDDESTLLYESLDEPQQRFFREEVIEGGVDFLTQKLSNLQARVHRP